jgi:hypothetical protein
MTTVNKALAFVTLNKFADSRVELIEGMHKAGYTLETARPVVIEWSCERAGVGTKGYNVSESGKVTLNTAHKKYETIKTVVRDVMLMLQGTTRRAASGKAEVDLVAVAVRAFGKLNAAQKRKFLASI